MTALLAGLGGVACFLLGLRGLVLVRDPGAVAAQGGPLLGTRVRDQRKTATRLVVSLSKSLSPAIIARLDPPFVRRIDQRLDVAGRPKGATVELLIASQVVYAVVALVVGFVVYTALGSPVLAVLVGFALLAAPVGSVWIEGRKRQGRIERELPEFMDVLAVVMQAGMSYRSGLWRVTEELKGPVAQELRRALREMELGAARRDAFRRVGERNDSRNLSRFIVAQTQAEELGVPLAEAIKTLANEMRRRYDQALRRWAARRATAITLVNSTVILLGCLAILVVAMLFAAGVTDILSGPIGDTLGG